MIAVHPGWWNLSFDSNLLSQNEGVDLTPSIFVVTPSVWLPRKRFEVLSICRHSKLAQNRMDTMTEKFPKKNLKFFLFDFWWIFRDTLKGWLQNKFLEGRLKNGVRWTFQNARQSGAFLPFSWNLIPLLFAQQYAHGRRSHKSSRSQFKFSKKKTKKIVEKSTADIFFKN